MFANLHFINDPEPRGAALNMAIDEVLLSRATAPTLRVYRWTRPAVSFGYFEKWKPVQNVHPERELVRRWTGGGVVPHGEDFTYSLIVPRTKNFAWSDVAESYRAIHETVARALGESGFDATVAAADEKKRSSACFENPVRFDILLNNRKIAGAAQRRGRNGCLHQGSIQLPQLPWSFADALAVAFSKEIECEDFDVPDEAVALAESKYATENWTRRL